ncbi:MAG: hypothetical protein IH627_07285 [Rubrivivax sp.]|nr:hypothetical protein [Rubrivivax sp.]
MQGEKLLALGAKGDAARDATDLLQRAVLVVQPRHSQRRPAFSMAAGDGGPRAGTGGRAATAMTSG